MGTILPSVGNVRRRGARGVANLTYADEFFIIWKFPENTPFPPSLPQIV